MSGEAFPSQREHERLPITLTVNCRTEINFLNMQTKNISIGGMFLRTVSPLPEGTELNLCFNIPEVPIEFTVMAEIIWSVGSAECENKEDCGMGVKFINMNKERSMALEKYIKERI